MSTGRSLIIFAILCDAVFLTASAQVSRPPADVIIPSLMAPRPLSPDTGAGWIRTRPVFVWTSVPGAVSYVLQVTQDLPFGPAAMSDTLGLDTIAVSPRLLVPGSRYCWRVGAVDVAGRGVFSDSLWCATGPAPSARPVRLPDSRRDQENTAFTVIRNGNAYPVTIDSAHMHPRMFVRSLLPLVIGAGDSVIARLAYRPRMFRDDADTLLLATESGDIAVAYSARCSPPVLVARASQVTLGPVAVTDSAAATLEFINAGPFNKLTVRRVRTRTQFFSASFLPVRTLEPGEVLRVPVKFHVRAFKPDAFGTYTDTCLVDSDGGYGRVVLRGDSPSPRAWIEPQVLSFGDVAAQDTAVAVLRLMNRSVNDLRVDSVGNRTKAVRTLVTRGRVGRSDTLSLPFRFVAGRYGVFADTVVLVNNSWWGPVRIPVVATVPYPVLETGMDRIDFGVVRRNDTAGVVVRLASGSISALRVDSIRTRTRAFRFSRPTLPYTIRRGDTLAFTLYFFPDSVRYFSDTLVIGSNASGGPRRIVISGNGAPPGATGGSAAMPGAFELFQNFPNPFRGTTTFRYATPEPGHVRLEIFTTLGQQVALLVDGEQDAGFHNVAWTATVTSGVYYYRLVATPRSDPGRQYKGTRKMVVMR
jgi:hypothetical protein